MNALEILEHIYIDPVIMAALYNHYIEYDKMSLGEILSEFMNERR